MAMRKMEKCPRMMTKSTESQAHCTDAMSLVRHTTPIATTKCSPSAMCSMRGARRMASHISGGYYDQLTPGELTDNLQQPDDLVCSNPSGYQVVVLTYTRNRLTGRMGTLERMISPLP
jgi:hypothetical protein